MSAQVIIKTDQVQAVIFDMDGVITKTAKVHALAWKHLFEEVLGEPFDQESDYLQFVDGKVRIDGIRSFLKSRGIVMNPEKIEEMANQKNQTFSELLDKGGIEVFETTVALIKQLKEKGMKVAVISSSRNCEKIMKTVDVLKLFDVRVDGIISEQLGIQGKPEPDIFLEAAKQLGVSPSRAVVVEDALSGVQAGKKGGFGLVIGVDRVGQADALKENGADVVVSDLGEVEVK